MRRLLVAALLAVTSLPTPARAWIQIDGPGQSKFALGSLIAPQLGLVEDVRGTRDRTVRYTPLLRRARILMSGQVMPMMGFFFDTDISNVGANGDWTPRMLLQDAIVELNLLPQLQLDMGHFIVPFSHIAMQAAAALLGVDYAALAVQQPPSYVDAKGVEFASNLAWRDVGLMLRGQLAHGVLEYRLAVTQGMVKFDGGSTISPHAWPRVTGRLVYNLFDSEGQANAANYLYAGLYMDVDNDDLLTRQRHVSLAAGASYQNDATLLKNGALSDYAAYNVDLFVDWPVFSGLHAISGQLNYNYYSRGLTALPTSTAFAELGYRIHKVEPVAGLEWAHAHGVTQPDQYYWRIGANYWIAAHRASLKVDVGQKRLLATLDTTIWAARLQGQVMF